MEGRLLVLDDDVAVADAIALVAGQFGFQTQVATTADDFFGAFAAWEPTHVAIDLAMPEMDGVEVLRILAQVHCAARVILTSGADAKVLESAHQSGVEHGLDICGTLPKPFRKEQLRLLLSDPGAAQRRPGGDVGARAAPAISAVQIEAGLREDQFVLHLQPKLRLRPRELMGFEALVRWQHPLRGLVYPGDFIPVAEQDEVITPLTYRVIDLGLQWLEGFGPERRLSLSINLSARNLDDMVLAERLHGECMARRIEPACVILELTETSSMRNPVEALDLLTRLRLKGFRLSMDDFGTGYSSMVQLARLPFSEIKVDKSFVSQMAHSQESRKIVEATIGLGTSLGLATVGEGVEDEATLAMLGEVGCEFAQGYFISRPMPAESVRDWMASQSADLIGPH